MTKRNVSKFNLKVYAYVYNQLFDFPPSEISYEVIATNNFFFFHYSHKTGDIIG